MSITDKVKEISHAVSEGYLIHGKDINDEIYKLYRDGDISNNEILKRVCELVNQNVYLSLFNDSSTDKSSIKFNYADYESIAEDVEMVNKDVSNYDFSPEDFRNGLLGVKTASLEKVASINETSYESKEMILRKVASLESGLYNMMNSLETIKSSFTKVAEDSYIKMKKEAKLLSYNNESIGDLSKLASDRAALNGYDMNKIANAYNIISEELISEGYSVNSELTKVASMDVDLLDSTFDTSEKLSESIDAIAAIDEMVEKIAEVKEIVSRSIDA